MIDGINTDANRFQRRGDSKRPRLKILFPESGKNGATSDGGM